MPIDRFFYPEHLSESTEITLCDQELHHLAHVTRARIAEHVEIVNGQGQLGIAVVKTIEKKRATLGVLKVSTSFPKGCKTILAQAIPRLNRLDFIVEKGTELGMDGLQLFPAEKSEKKQLSNQQMQRLKKISISAMKQCGRLFLPSITVAAPLVQWESFPVPSYFGDIASSAKTMIKRWQSKPPKEECTFFIGPEAGFTEQEIEQLRKNGVEGVALHPNILRTDTASLTALAIMHQLIMIQTREFTQATIK